MYILFLNSSTTEYHVRCNRQVLIEAQRCSTIEGQNVIFISSKVQLSYYTPSSVLLTSLPNVMLPYISVCVFEDRFLNIFKVCFSQFLPFKPVVNQSLLYSITVSTVLKLMTYFSFYFFHLIPCGSEVCIHSVFSNMAFKVFNLSQIFVVAVCNLLHNKLLEILSIPP